MGLALGSTLTEYEQCFVQFQLHTSSQVTIKGAKFYIYRIYNYLSVYLKICHRVQQYNMFIVGYNQRVRILGLVSVVCVGAGGGNINYISSAGWRGEARLFSADHNR